MQTNMLVVMICNAPLAAAASNYAEGSARTVTLLKDSSPVQHLFRSLARQNLAKS